MIEAGGQYDVVVVGGGPGGTYAAWRLKTGALGPGPSTLPADPAHRRIALLESSNRIGGRLESLRPPDIPTLRAEFGGMGYSEQHDLIISSLINSVFNLASEPFVLPNAQDLVYVRGTHLRSGDLTDPSKLPYRLAPDEVGKTPGELIVQAVDRLIPGGSGFTTEQWRQAAKTVKIGGRLLQDIGYWNFLLMGMSNEAFNFCTDTMGHFFEFDNWNAAQALPWLLSQSVAPYRTLAAGYDGIPKSMFGAFVAAEGLAAFEAPVTGVTGTAGGPLTVAVDGGAITANRVILAMPRRALELIAPSTPVLDTPEVRQLMSTVTGRKVMKIFLTYREAWWNQLQITSGASNTDLPMSQCWYFDPPSGSTNALLMASYNDTLKTTYWQGLEGGTPFPGEAGNDPFWAQQVASDLMVEELQRQLSEMHQLTVPDPYSAAYRDWTQDPFGGAYYTWNVGVDVGDVARRMLQPDPTIPLHVCGSAYSFDQGWTEGALATAEQVVTEFAGLAPPPWWPSAKELSATDGSARASRPST